MKTIKKHWKGLIYGLVITIVMGIFALVFRRK